MIALIVENFDWDRYWSYEAVTTNFPYSPESTRKNCGIFSSLEEELIVADIDPQFWEAQFTRT